MFQPKFESIQTDHTKIKPGDWFLPMTIKDVDQHAFIQNALDAGAIGFSYLQGAAIPQSEKPSAAVPDLREYLFSLAREKRPQLNSKVVVITGSAGKTTVKEIVGCILTEWNSQQVFISPENQNTKIALATQILRLPLETSIAAFEMGARRPFDFQIPLSFLQPDVVALLNVGTAHLGEFGSLENLQKEKLSALAAPSASKLVAFGDDPLVSGKAYAEREKSPKKDVILFGLGQKNHVRVLDETSESLTLSLWGKTHCFACCFEGSARALNVAAAVAIVRALDIPIEVIETALKKFSGVPRRFQNFRWGSTPAIDDAYNASPESMQQGLLKVASLSSGKNLLLVLGSMLELGASSEQSHRDIAHLILKHFDTDRVTVATVGQDAQFIAEELAANGFSKWKLQSFATSTEAAQTLEAKRSQFDLAYFKASKSIALHKIFGAS